MTHLFSFTFSQLLSMIHVHYPDTLECSQLISAYHSDCSNSLSRPSFAPQLDHQTTNEHETAGSHSRNTSSHAIDVRAICVVCAVQASSQGLQTSAELPLNCVHLPIIAVRPASATAAATGTGHCWTGIPGSVPPISCNVSVTHGPSVSTGLH